MGLVFWQLSSVLCVPVPLLLCCFENNSLTSSSLEELSLQEGFCCGKRERLTSDHFRFSAAKSPLLGEEKFRPLNLKLANFSPFSLFSFLRLSSSFNVSSEKLSVLRCTFGIRLTNGVRISSFDGLSESSSSVLQTSSTNENNTIYSFTTCSDRLGVP